MQKLEFESVGSCAVCLSKESTRVEVATAYHHRLEYRACSTCGLVRMDPRPTYEAVGRFYASFYMGGSARDIEATRAKQRDFAYFLLSVIASHLRLDRIRTVLDLGCGYGETLAVIAKALGNYGEVSLHGIEPSGEARAIAESTCKIVGHSHDDLAGSQHQYDLIVMSHVLEHMADPVAALKLLRSKLTSAGVLALEVPNYFCHPSTDIVHNFLFTEVSLKNTFMKAGFELLGLHATDHASSYRPAYLTAVAKLGVEGAIVRESPHQVLAGRRAAMSKWPGFTAPSGAKQFAKKLLRRSALG
jgi:trans-aconitate methyltransferase